MIHHSTHRIGRVKQHMNDIREKNEANEIFSGIRERLTTDSVTLCNLGCVFGSTQKGDDIRRVEQLLDHARTILFDLTEYPTSVRQD